MVPNLPFSAESVGSGFSVILNFLFSRTSTHTATCVLVPRSMRNICSESLQVALELCLESDSSLSCSPHFFAISELACISSVGCFSPFVCGTHTTQWFSSPFQLSSESSLCLREFLTLSLSTSATRMPSPSPSSYTIRKKEFFFGCRPSDSCLTKSFVQSCKMCQYSHVKMVSVRSKEEEDSSKQSSRRIFLNLGSDSNVWPIAFGSQSADEILCISTGHTAIKVLLSCINAQQMTSTLAPECHEPTVVYIQKHSHVVVSQGDVQGDSQGTLFILVHIPGLPQVY